MRIEPHSKVVFIGDSITDANRVQPIAEGLFDPLGRGYVTMIEALFLSTYPEHGIRIVNVGTSGNTIRDLAARWQRDVLDLKPDWLSVMIGINDVWRQFDMPRQKEAHVGLDEYEKTYKQILEKVRPSLKGLVLCAPYYIESLKQDAMRIRMTEYAKVVKKLAGKFDATFVDMQADYDKVLKHMHSAALAWDRIHPNQGGHMIMARAWVKAIGYQF